MAHDIIQAAAKRDGLGRRREMFYPIAAASEFAERGPEHSHRTSALDALFDRGNEKLIDPFFALTTREEKSAFLFANVTHYRRTVLAFAELADRSDDELANEDLNEAHRASMMDTASTVFGADGAEEVAFAIDTVTRAHRLLDASTDIDWAQFEFFTYLHHFAGLVLGLGVVRGESEDSLLACMETLRMSALHVFATARLGVPDELVSAPDDEDLISWAAQD